MSDVLEIRDYQGEGYRPLVDFETWRVAILRWEATTVPGMIERMERHTQTDEVFILLEGQATIILGGNATEVKEISTQVMERGKLYNVKRNAWHSVVLSRDASILIVENRDTGEKNTEHCALSEEMRRAVRSMRLGEDPG